VIHDNKNALGIIPGCLASASFLEKKPLIIQRNSGKMHSNASVGAIAFGQVTYPISQ